MLSTVILASLLSNVFAAPMMPVAYTSAAAYGAQAKVDPTWTSTMMAEKAMATMMMDKASTTMMMDGTSTTMMMDATSTTMAAEATSTWGSSSSSSTTTNVIYGSGSTTWGGSGYNSCVQQCMASYGAPPTTYTPPPSSDSSYSGSDMTPPQTPHRPPILSSSLPPKGAMPFTTTFMTSDLRLYSLNSILRFVPFAVNASVGDTLHFVWNAGPHTVTQSSEFTPCNKTSAPGAFASGLQNASFTFDQVVNNTDSIYYYCGVPGHCEKGMFGIINPPNTDPGAVGTLPVAGSSNTTSSSNSTMSVGSWVMSQASSDASMAAMYNYVVNQTMGTSAYGWGMAMDLSGFPETSYADVAQNIMYTSLMYAANPGMLEKGQGATGTNITLPADISTFTNLAASSSSSTTPAAGAYGGAYGAATTSSANAQSTAAAVGAVANGASGRLVTSTGMVGLVALVASLMAL
ncbi:hypothetical protein FRB95_010972 [Tulasnella sp. JGI-2019a]|nr:hypothetical protein FRB95_010972 [Tulasnella sp. JGI-2019a]